jgi:hypothetical protein
MSDKKNTFEIRPHEWMTVRSFQLVAQAKLQGYMTDDEDEYPVEEYELLRLTYVIEDRPNMPINTPYLERIEIYE